MSKYFRGHDRRHFGTVTTLTAAVMTALYGSAAMADDNALQEVVVTATRRALSAQDVPISITAVSGAALDQAGIQDISGLARSVAGVNFTDKGPFGGVNGSSLIIRGLNSEQTGGQLALASPVVPPVSCWLSTKSSEWMECAAKVRTTGWGLWRTSIKT